MVRIDHNTEDAIRGRYARVALEIDISKPLQSQVFVDDRWFHISYENIPDICFTCGLVGHSMASCPSTLNVSPSSSSSPAGSTVLITSPTTTAPPSCQPRGEWIVAAPRQQRSPRSTATHQKRDQGPNKESSSIKGGNTSTNSGSRFDVLLEYVPVERPEAPGSVHAPHISAASITDKSMLSTTMPAAPRSSPNRQTTKETQTPILPSAPEMSITNHTKGNPSLYTAVRPSTSETTMPAFSLAPSNSPTEPTKRSKPVNTELTSKPRLNTSTTDLAAHTKPASFPHLTLDFPTVMHAHVPPPIALSKLQITDSTHGKAQRRVKKLNSPMPYSRLMPQDSSRLSHDNPMVIPSTVVPSQCTFSALLEKITTNHGNTKPMDVSFDTRGLSHSVIREAAPIVETSHSVLGHGALATHGTTQDNPEGLQEAAADMDSVSS
ncbi:hypothetical protein Tsubulata_016095 [Turnera subulata]|uniref:CCHC-type domain-containing protein n=1 Tax=Turnera subulata TaxID=218843 RepID=A0A9Q0FGL3_9ROSI|nr:hypothetical protein Tsubulata_016095 [Turnera subulata]